MISTSERCDAAKCREPAHWRDAAGFAFCERHATTELLAHHSIFGADDGEPVELVDGEISWAS